MTLFNLALSVPVNANTLFWESLIYVHDSGHAPLCCYVESHHHMLMQVNYCRRPIRQHFVKPGVINPQQCAHKKQFNIKENVSSR